MVASGDGQGVQRDDQFICRFDTMRFELMEFGLINAPTTFQRTIDAVLKDLSFARFYLNDVGYYSDNLEDHLVHCENLVSRTVSNGKKIKLHVDKTGVATGPENIKAVQEAPHPTFATELRGFPGLANNYRNFTSRFEKASAALRDPTLPNKNGSGR